MPRALITGVSGQDGSYLAELLLAKRYEVHGTVRPSLMQPSALVPDFVEALRPKIEIHPLRLEEPRRLYDLIARLGCDECYHLAGPSTVDRNMRGEPGLMTLILDSTKAALAAIDDNGRRCRLFFAGSSEMFGKAATSPQNEQTDFRPRSIYGLARLAAYHAIRMARRHSGVYACTGILYNHESARRASQFLPRKVSLAAARIKLGTQRRLSVGNLEAVRDWGYAPDFVEAMWLMLHQSAPRDFVVATGRTHSVAELAETAFASVGLDFRKFVDVDSRYFRPSESVSLCGDAAELQQATGWRPKKAFDAMIAEMVACDLATAAKPQH